VGVLLTLFESEGYDAKGTDDPTRYTHQQLASMIGSNREAVTRALSELREDGVSR
jgi:CRP-like cAMP-binding protein